MITFILTILFSHAYLFAIDPNDDKKLKLFSIVLENEQVFEHTRNPLYEDGNFVFVLNNRYFHPKADKYNNLYIIDETKMFDYDVQYFVFFDQFDINNNRAELKFHTTSRYKNTSFNLFYEFNVFMKFENNLWHIKKIKKKEIKCCNWIYDEW
jgi:hypothetical protein